MQVIQISPVFLQKCLASPDKQTLSPIDFIHQYAFNDGPFTAFKTGRLSGLYRQDPRQEAVILKLQELHERIQKNSPSRNIDSGLTMVEKLSPSETIKGKTNWFSGIVKMMNNSKERHNGTTRKSRNRVELNDSFVRGLYLYGGVGVGKTMLMDLFVSSKPSHIQVKRLHFHDFMLDVHKRLKDQSHKQDPLEYVASTIASCAHVLALDELFVTDVADAMIINRLFKTLWNEGMILIATSNRKPDDLYLGGLQRDLFLPFIDNLKEVCEVHDMESAVDYRKLARHNRGVYFTGRGKNTFLSQAFEQKSLGFGSVKDRYISLQMGRKMQVPISAGVICFFSFHELCVQPVGAADYIGLCQHFHTVFLQDIPIINSDNKSAAYRFVSLIDILYDNRIRLICSAEGDPVELFKKVLSHKDSMSKANEEEDIVVDDNLAFAKDRTVSRLIEMESMEYLAEHANRHAPELLLALAEKEENTTQQKIINL
eukprot:g2860.t1